MCSVLTHPIVPLALAAFLPQDTLSPTLVLVGAVCAVIPDVDVIGRQFGVGAHPLLGHRGLTHSIVFAAALGALLTYLIFHNSPAPSWVVFLFLFVSTLSHPLLDMLTNGGRGVALFAPFSSVRYFFPWRPIEVSPISVRRFFSRRGVQIMRSELRWVWLPSVGVYILGMIVRRYG
jgi:inner membrane protein